MRSVCNHTACLALGLVAASGAIAAPPTTMDAWVGASSDGSFQGVVGPDVGFSEGLDHRNGSPRLRVVATDAGMARLRRDGWQVDLAASGSGVRDGYRLTPEGFALLDDLAATYENAGLQQWGESHNGRPILALWIGQPPEVGAPSVRIAGAHHGDESSSFEVALAVAESLLSRPSSNTAITDLLASTTVWVIPYVNPDGVASFTRQNAMGVDLNRNYGLEWSVQAFQSGDAPFSEPEVQAIRDSALLTVPYTSLSLHSGATNIGYPYNYTFDDTAEERVMRALCDVYADEVDDPNFYVTNGADWYPTTGDTNDWSYGSYGGMDYTLELTAAKTPPTDVLAQQVRDHTGAVLQWLSQTPDVLGEVRDANTGEPIAAQLVATNGRSDTSVVFYANPLSGRFARYLAAGDAALRISAPGYTSVTQDIIGQQQGVIELVPLQLQSRLPQSATTRAGQRLTLPEGIGTAVTLTRPAITTVLAVRDSSTGVPDDQPPGPYTLVASDGRTWPNAVFIEGGGAAELTLGLPENGQLHITGRDLGLGPVAIVLAGDHRTPVPLSLINATETDAYWSLAGLPIGQFDVWVHTNGTHALFDVTHDTMSDTDTADTADAAPPFRLERTGCACSAQRQPSVPLGLLGCVGLWGALLVTRRRPS
ncbi:MAG: hypothetical protein ACI855_003655 [Myxococcota bacterium]|jgi:hypothetical protein